MWGAAWGASVPVPLDRGGSHPTSAAALQSGAEGLAAARVDLETTFVAALEEALGLSPAWTRGAAEPG